MVSRVYILEYYVKRAETPFSIEINRYVLLPQEEYYFKLSSNSPTSLAINSGDKIL